MPKRKIATRVALHPAYLAELRRRVDALGFRAIARAAGMGISTLWRVLEPSKADQPTTVDAALRVRDAIANLDPSVPPLPDPVAGVRGAAHHAWCALGDVLDDADAAAFARAMTAPVATIRAELRRAIATLSKRAAR